ncbi:MAG: hypothetical protein GWN84_20610 [Gammaproteobacteria bacterium]|nr:hypothetical protein [Gammaproteobacteria bacterium]NIR85164.1 hypothetical protein [Gammaproteobacteria bacterium]NIU06213.1 hypothetical protein [Gammaproteobacteria bacterium]NIX87486.1 hypothetical protein [Gammaproteobacteria bacterium]
MRALVVAMVMVGAAGCGASLQDATRLHNGTRAAVQAADALAAPWIRAEIATAQWAHPEDDAAYERGLEPALAVRDALRDARDAEQRLHLAVRLWEQGDDGAWPEAAACAADALRDAAELLEEHEIGTGAEAGALDALAAALAAEAGQPCPQGPEGPGGAP